MIKITIEQVTTEKYMETKNFITKSTPTDKVQSSEYGHHQKVVCAEEYATREVELQRTIRTKLLEQEIINDEEFDLKRVIAAINRTK